VHPRPRARRKSPPESGRQSAPEDRDRAAAPSTAEAGPRPGPRPPPPAEPRGPSRRPKPETRPSRHPTAAPPQTEPPDRAAGDLAATVRRKRISGKHHMGRARPNCRRLRRVRGRRPMAGDSWWCRQVITQGRRPRPGPVPRRRPDRARRGGGTASATRAVEPELFKCLGNYGIRFQCLQSAGRRRLQQEFWR
jgi:hypothetical protein